MMVARDRMLWELHVRSRHDGLWKGQDGREWTIAGEHLQENATGRTTRVRARHSLTHSLTHSPRRW